MLQETHKLSEKIKISFKNQVNESREKGRVISKKKKDQVCEGFHLSDGSLLIVIETLN